MPSLETRSSIARQAGWAGALLLLALAACGTDTTVPPESTLTSPSPSGTGLPSDSSRHQVPNAVAGIRILPQTITVVLNGSAAVPVYPVDASGIPSLALLAGQPTWSVRNPNIATVSADGRLRAVALGTTKVFAIWNSYKDSATVHVVASRDSAPNSGGNNGRPDTTSNGGGNNGGNGGRPDTIRYTPPTPVASFNLSALILGRATPVSPRDTAHVVQMAGATVSLYRLAALTSSHSDSMNVRTLVQTVTANSSGKATFANVPSGYYSVVATATLEGSALEGQIDFGPPRESEFAVAVYLYKK